MNITVSLTKREADAFLYAYREGKSSVDLLSADFKIRAAIIDEEQRSDNVLDAQDTG